MKNKELVGKVQEVVGKFAEPGLEVKQDTAFVKDLGLESIQPNTPPKFLV